MVAEWAKALCTRRRACSTSGSITPSRAARVMHGRKEAQGPLGLEEGVGGSGRRPQDGLQQALQGRIHPGHAHQQGAATALLEHL